MKCYVIGDTILDVYVCGQTRQTLAPEGCLVHEQMTSNASPGGAALVARQLRALGHDVMLHTQLGVDFEGHISAEGLEEEGITLLLKQGGRTTRKMRYMSKGKCLLRADLNQPVMPHEYCEEAYTADLVVISDYGLGVVTPPPAELVKRGVPVYVDPFRTRHPRYYGEVRAITPCLDEALQSTGSETTDQAFDALMAYAEVAIITMGEGGCEVRYEDCKHLVPAIRPVPVDVIGAGDVFLAAFAAWDVELGVEKAAEMATIAAAVQIGFYGPQPVSVKDDA